MGDSWGRGLSRGGKIGVVLLCAFTVTCHAQAQTGDGTAELYAQQQNTERNADLVQGAYQGRILDTENGASLALAGDAEQVAEGHGGKSPSATPQDAAVVAAVADGVTTGMALSMGAAELNPLVTATPVGLVAITGMKIGLVQYADTLPQEEKRTVMKASSSVWGGAAVNNLFVLMAAPPPFPMIAGLIMGLVTWQHMEAQYQQEDALIAARNAQQEAGAVRTGLAVAELAETLGN